MPETPPPYCPTSSDRRVPQKKRGDKNAGTDKNVGTDRTFSNLHSSKTRQRSVCPQSSVCQRNLWVTDAGCPTRGGFTGGPRYRWDQEILRMWEEPGTDGTFTNFHSSKKERIRPPQASLRAEVAGYPAPTSRSLTSFSILHHASQDPVDPRLVARAFGFEPLHHFTIHAQRDSLFPRTVPARFRSRLLLCQRKQIILSGCKQPVNRRPLWSRLSSFFLNLTCHDAIVQAASS